MSATIRNAQVNSARELKNVVGNTVSVASAVEQAAVAVAAQKSKSAGETVRVPSSTDVSAIVAGLQMPKCLHTAVLPLMKKAQRGRILLLASEQHTAELGRFAVSQGIDNIDVVAIDSSGQTEIKNVGEYELLLVTFDNVESIDLVRPIIRAAWIGEGTQFFEVGRWNYREGFLASLNSSTGTRLEIGGSVESKPLAVSRIRELS